MFPKNFVLFLATFAVFAADLTEVTAHEKNPEPDDFFTAKIMNAVNEYEQHTAVLGDEYEAKKSTNVEIQFEYLDARFYDERNINLYNFHVFEEAHRSHALTIWRGLTISRPVGYTTDKGVYADGQAVGIGPAIMLRWEKKLSGKLYGDLDLSGSLLLYNRAHPGGGRRYNFLWRIGPRLDYRFTDRDSVSLGYMFHHTSNGHKNHNPGYDGIGFSLGYSHKF